MTLPEQKLYIDGHYVDASSGETFATLNPANGELICRVQSANADDVDKAVGRALPRRNSPTATSSNRRFLPIAPTT